MLFEVHDLWPKVPIAMGAMKGDPPVYLTRMLERFAYERLTRVVALCSVWLRESFALVIAENGSL